MPRPKPKIFVGSSSEAKADETVRSVIAALLSADFHPTAWWDAEEFNRNSTTLDGLLDAADGYDFGLFIFTADDVTQSRSRQQPSARDNVLFEYGLFLGKLGPGRVRAVAMERKSGPRLKTPSDLLGVTMPSLSALSTSDLQISAQKAAAMMRTLSDEHGLRVPKVVPLEFGHDPSDGTVYVTYNGTTLLSARKHLREYCLALVAVKEDDGRPLRERSDFLMSAVRSSQPDSHRDVTISLHIDATKLSLAKDDIITILVLRCPTYFQRDVHRAKTIQDLIDGGCDVIADGGVGYDS